MISAVRHLAQFNIGRVRHALDDPRIGKALEIGAVRVSPARTAATE